MEHILVIEDEMLVALDLEHILASAGHHVVGIAPDSETALELAPACSMALVDVNLRDGKTGPRIAAEIFSRHGARIIFVTANPEQIGAVADIAVGRVAKPFDRRDILSAVEAAKEADLPDRLPDHPQRSASTSQIGR
jgi:DNA-binding response OmpR family regulator